MKKVTTTSGTWTWSRAATLLPGLVLAAGCAQLGGLEDVLGGLGGGVRDGELVEVQGVDTRDRTIEVLTENRARGQVRYDDRTRVIYQGRDYEVRALEFGDLVRMRIQQTQTGDPYTDRIDVERSASERDRDGFPSDSGERMEGEVGWLDREGGRFILDPSRDDDVMVFLPRNPPSDMLRTFRDLDPGDWIRVEVRPVRSGEAELVRFGWR